MNQSNAEFESFILAKVRTKAGEARQSLRVAVLGPGLGSQDYPEGQKRKQIRDALEDDGHHAFFPEESVISDPLLPPLIDQERELLAGTGVDLIIILHTSTSIGVIAEMGNFVSVPEINEKTVLLFPSVYYKPDQNLAANTARGYPVRMPYSDDHFDSCQLVSECRKWAHDRATGRWPGSMPHSF